MSGKKDEKVSGRGTGRSGVANSRRRKPASFMPGVWGQSVGHSALVKAPVFPKARKEARPRAKYAVICRHRNEYPVIAMCRFFQVSRGGYYDFVHRLGRAEKDAALAEIVAEQQERSLLTYGCRRMWLVLKKRGVHRNPRPSCAS